MIEREYEFGSEALRDFFVQHSHSLFNTGLSLVTGFVYALALMHIFSHA